jgi:hypothetical protein
MTESAVTEFTAPVLQGVWIHDVDDPEGTIRQFRYTERGRRHNHQVATNVLQFAGRTYSVYAYGENETRDVTMSMQVPYGTTYEDDMDALAALNTSRKQHVYRDGRGRIVFGNITVSDIDTDFGSSVDVTVSAAEFDEEVA